MMPARLAVGLLLSALVAGSTPAASQSIPPVTRSKEAARRAVDATNAHTSAMTDSTAGGATAARAPRTVAQNVAPTQGGSAPARATQSAAGRTAADTTATVFEREVFHYERAGRRDPFVSLMENGELRPLITEIRVTGIVYDESGRSSVAVLRDVGSKEQYRVRIGSSLGRMRVARIDRKSVTFTIEEFGFSRQETLQLSDDPNKETKQ
jgi:hypothetical protein